MAISACDTEVNRIETKSELRQFYRERLRALDKGERIAKSAAIAELLAGLSLFSATRSVMSYLSFGAEVDTGAPIGLWLQENRTVYAPRVRETDTLEWVEYASPDALTSGAYRTTGAHGVPEPLGPAVKSLPNAPVIVPGLAFTKNGQRLGRGLGCFDRFLAGHTGTRIGFAFECQIADALPTEPHDIPMDIVITESGIYRK
ncbi:MAG: 5-formyltetrahydrofolate cyclo-ligase [Candidatus Hydrogenedentes bacterium]|nr:5-formyltetrahydrofolate cyclo-ligase [Candidatus Hydrogenedentota bacterium]